MASAVDMIVQRMRRFHYPDPVHLLQCWTGPFDVPLMQAVGKKLVFVGFNLLTDGSL